MRSMRSLSSSDCSIVVPPLSLAIDPIIANLCSAALNVAAFYVSWPKRSSSGPFSCPYPPTCLEEGEFADACMRVSGWNERNRMDRGSVCRDYLVFGVHARATAVGKTAPGEVPGDGRRHPERTPHHLRRPRTWCTLADRRFGRDVVAFLLPRASFYNS